MRFPEQAREICVASILLNLAASRMDDAISVSFRRWLKMSMGFAVPNLPLFAIVPEVLQQFWCKAFKGHMKDGAVGKHESVDKQVIYGIVAIRAELRVNVR